MKPLRVVHLVYYGYEPTVIDSQVVAPARRLQAEGVDVELVFLEDPLPWLLGRWRPRKAELSAAGLRAHFLPRIPRNFLGLNTRRLSGLFQRFLSDQSPLVVHARGFQGADALLPFKAAHPGLKLICDARGIEWAEYELDIRVRRGRSLNAVEAGWKRALEGAEKRSVSASDLVLCVSRAMIPFLKGRDGGRDFDYVPCAVDVDAFSKGLDRRDETRRELNVGNALVLVYSGSMSAWQVPEASAKIAARFLSMVPDAFFLILSPTPGTLAELAVRAGIPRERLRAIRAAHADVPRYLAAADLALLLREENVVNKYACPTKFAEYLACGLHVISTPAVEEVASTIRETGCGTIMASLDDAGEIDRALKSALVAAGGPAVRMRASAAVARERYDWARHLATLKKWYFQLANFHPT